MTFQAPPEEVMRYLAQLDDASVADLLDRARESFGKPAANSEAQTRGQTKLCSFGTCDCCPKTDVKEETLKEKKREGEETQQQDKKEDEEKKEEMKEESGEPRELSAAQRRTASEDLIQALQATNLRLATHLSSRSDPRHLDENGWSVLHWIVHLAGTARSSSELATINESEEATGAGASADRSLLDTQDGAEEAVGCECCRPEKAPPEIRSFLKKYLEGPSVEVDVRSSDNATALMFAADAGDEEVCEWLLSAGADPALQDDDEDKPADWARKQGHLELADRLERRR